ncbi:unnamed protein product [Pararhodospirillum photometricum DSM 122]|uniref:Uncharacterized protein n=1 Tax=Pararhodospirillum photometricum DSM 122 TaxID=1150469 RepID=H6SMP5_PARPM|nr:unnamed protein product [Pararhodospirillum photometricum DSM 122]
MPPQDPSFLLVNRLGGLQVVAKHGRGALIAGLGVFQQGDVFGFLVGEVSR